MTKRQFKNISIYGTIIILVITAVLFFIKTTKISFSNALDTDILSDYSAFAFGFIGILLTVLNLLLAIQNFNFQENTFEKQQFENHFFTLLQIHRDNYNNAQNLFGLNNDSKDLFSDFYDKFIEIQLNATTNFYLYKNIELIKILFNEVSEEEQNKEAVKNYITRITEIYSKDVTANASKHISSIFVPYTILFYGVYNVKSLTNFHSVGLEILKDYLNSDVIEELRESLVAEDEDIKGYNEYLGKYFRHLYNLIKYIDSSKVLTLIEKKAYAKIVRSQLSDYEQIIFFLNSLTPLGENWEIKGNNDYITEYQLIKNIPRAKIKSDLFGLDPIIFYPKIQFEDDRF